MAFIQGIGIGAGLIVAIGAQNVFVFSQGVRREHQWLVALICSACDALLIFLGTAGVGTVVASSQRLQDIAGWGGAIFLGWYGFRALRSAMDATSLKVNDAMRSSRWAVTTATLGVTLLNPHVYLDTLLLLGSASGQFPGNDRYLFALGASSASLVWFHTLSLSGIALAPFFQSTRAWRILDSLVCCTMWTLAFQLIPITIFQ